MSIRSPYGVSIHWNVSPSPGGPARNDTALVLSVIGATETIRAGAERDAAELAVDDGESRLPVERERCVASRRAQRDGASERDRPREAARVRLVHVASRRSPRSRRRAPRAL